MFSREALRLVGALIGSHLALWVIVVAIGAQYDSRGLEQLLWWVVALWILPVVSLIVLASYGLNDFQSWLKRRRQAKQGKEL
ncbi:hypothetical protein [Sphingopyxis terrae]|uniref:hypothetical protein n=1 Tax=Sphingopyxis terrae TaxID=33052 RepID=UPI002A0CEB8E|nr:hypothetical protein [Sphingopyxis terrae]MDX8356259.1 hypothetical protein [Sphingopyxis terrae]